MKIKYHSFYVMVLLLFFVTIGKAQQHSISGKVIDATTQEALTGVNIAVQGTTIGTSTDYNGEYSLLLPSANVILSVTYIGYITEVIEVNGRQTIDISLRPDVIMGNELVVIGYGQQKERDLTGSISTIRAQDFANLSYDSPEKFLQGRVAGVQFTTNSGQPGGSSTIRIRGSASVNAGSMPLFVIDGVPIDLSTQSASSGTAVGAGLNPLASIHPNDIESISVLKDASATAIYGARGSNGVIIVTTKTGRIGKPVINFSATTGFQTVGKKLSLLNAEQFARIRNQAGINGGTGPVYTEEEIAGFGEGTDWQDELFQTGSLQRYHLSISGGDQNTRYMVSGGFSTNQGIILGSDLENINLRVNLNANLSDRLRIGNNFSIDRVNSNVALTSTQSSGSGSGVVLGAIYMSPIQSIYRADGSYELFNDTGRDFPNPIAVSRELSNTVQNTRFVNNFFFELDLLENLQVRSSVGVNNLNNDEALFKPDGMFLFATTNNQARRGILNSNYLTLNNTINYRTDFGSEQRPQSVELLGGFTIESENRERLSAGANTFPSNNLMANNLSAGADILTPNSQQESFSLVSYLSRVNYSYNDKYLLTASARLDGSSRFGADNKYGFFPSAAFAWRLSGEDFIQRMDLFDDMKFRVSYGQTGNQDIGNYRSLSMLSSTSTYLGNNIAIGFSPNNLGNPDLKWETTTQFNVGTDLTFLDGMVSITMDYYSKTTNDLLFELPVPMTSGFSNSLVNLGEVRNSGFEFLIRSGSIILGPVNWLVSFNIARNRNEVVDLGERGSFLAGPTMASGTDNIFLIEEGRPLGTFYGRVFDRMSDTGTIIYKDVGEDGRAVIGNAHPDFTGGMTSNMLFKNFEFSVSLSFVQGNKLFNTNRFELDVPNGFQNNSTAVLNYWTPENTNTKIPAPSPNRALLFDDRMLEDGSYLRFQNITLAYNLPTTTASKINLNNLRIYVSADNLITITNYSGYDPEVSAFEQSNLTMGVDHGVYPMAKSYRIGFELGF